MKNLFSEVDDLALEGTKTEGGGAGLRGWMAKNLSSAGCRMRG